MKKSQFISLMSESLGVEEKTIGTIVRMLREAGLFTTGARGVNAPDMTTLDAVRVVLAVVASPFPHRAVRDVKYFGSLKPDLRVGIARESFSKHLNPDATLEEILVQCAENQMPYMALIAGYIELSETGGALLNFDSAWYPYHQREQLAAILAKHDDEAAMRRAHEAWEAGARIANVKVDRSAKFHLERLHQIGFEILGWEVD